MISVGMGHGRPLPRRHTGEYRGLPPTGGTFEVTGHVTFRFQGEKIAETWFNWDLQGLMEQLGSPTDTAL
ncbi:ester cyclase [Streptomyces olivaceus]